jgi:hypothetical protein
MFSIGQEGRFFFFWGGGLGVGLEEWGNMLTRKGTR